MELLLARNSSLQCCFSPQEKPWKVSPTSADTMLLLRIALPSARDRCTLRPFSPTFYHPPSPVTDRRSSTAPIGRERVRAASPLATVNDVTLRSDKWELNQIDCRAVSKLCLLFCFSTFSLYVHLTRKHNDKPCLWYDLFVLLPKLENILYIIY